MTERKVDVMGIKSTVERVNKGKNTFSFNAYVVFTVDDDAGEIAKDP